MVVPSLNRIIRSAPFFCIVVTDYFRVESTRTVKERVGLLGGKAVTTFFAGKLMLLV